MVISYLSLGSGPAVIVVPGALSMAADYLPFAEALAKYYFAVHILERRGRGQSGPQGDDYCIAKECEDVQAVQAKTGATFLVGHSYGGLVALEAARRTSAFAALAVYEPGVSIHGSIRMDWVPAYKKALADGKSVDAFVEFVRGTGPARARQTPHWLMRLLLPRLMDNREYQQRLRLLPQNLNEHKEVARLDSSYQNYRAITAKTLLIYGGKDTIEWITPMLDGLTEVLSGAEVAQFPRLDHFGIDRGGPQEVARTVSDYFLASTVGTQE